MRDAMAMNGRYPCQKRILQLEGIFRSSHILSFFAVIYLHFIN